MAAPHPAVGWTRRGGRAAGGGREPGSGKRAAGAVRGGSAEPLPPLPGALRAAALRAALGHAPAAGRCGSAAPRPLRAPPPVPAAGLCWGATVGGCPRTAAVPGRLLSPDGGCHQPAAVTRRAAGAPGRARRVSIAVRPPRGEKRGERSAAVLGEVPAAPAKPNLPPAARRHPRPPGPASSAAARPPRPRSPRRRAPTPSPLRSGGRPRQKSPPEGADKGAPDRSLTEFSSPEPLPFIFSSQKYARPLWRLGAAWAGEPPAAAGHGVPGGQRCASGVPTCQSATDVPPMYHSATGVSPTCHRGAEPRPGSLCAPPDLNAEIPFSSKNYICRARYFRFASKRPRWFGTEEPGRGSLFACFRGAQPARRREKGRGPFPKGGAAGSFVSLGR